MTTLRTAILVGGSMSKNRLDFCMCGYRYAARGDSRKLQSYSMVASLLDVKLTVQASPW